MNGVNDNGVYWVEVDSNDYLCTYYFGDGVEVSKEFKSVSINFIEKLTFEDLKAIN